MTLSRGPFSPHVAAIVLSLLLTALGDPVEAAISPLPVITRAMAEPSEEKGDPGNPGPPGEVTASELAALRVRIQALEAVVGEPPWDRRFGGGGQDTGRSIVADGSGNVLVTGSFEGEVLLDEGSLLSAGDEDVFVAKYSGIDGRYLWARRLGGTELGCPSPWMRSATSLSRGIS